MKSKNPKVSVCIPCYNHGRFVGEAIQSVLDQTFADFELIVVDDHSSDNSESIIRNFSDKRIKLFRNDRNIGRVKNINKCLSLALGEYISILPSDDLYASTSLEKRVKILDSNPKIGLVYSCVEHIDENGFALKKYCYSDRDYIRSGEEEFKSLMFRNYMPAPTVMVRRECYASLGTFNEAVTGHSDWEMWLRITLNNFDVAFIAQPLAYEREHSGNVSNYYRLTNLAGMNKYRAVKTVFSNLPKEKKHLSSLEPQVVKSVAIEMLEGAAGNLIHGRSSLARRNVALAIAIDDSLSKDWRTYIVFISTFNRGIEYFLKKLPFPIKMSFYRILARRDNP